METQLRLVGIVLVLLAGLHAIFPRYFEWAKELTALSLVNRQLMYVHTFFIGLVLALMGLLCLNATPELVGSSLGHKICAGLSIFWATRLLVQFVGYSPKLWRGKAFETTIHWVFSGLWVYLSGVFLWVAIGI